MSTTRKTLRDVLKQLSLEEEEEEKIESAKEEKEKEEVAITPKRARKDETEEEVFVVTEAPKKQAVKTAPTPQPLGVINIFELLDDPNNSPEEKKSILNAAWRKFGPRVEFLKYMDLLSNDQVVALLRHIISNSMSETEKILAENLLKCIAHGGVR